ncbi:hypothetical protein [Bacillus infantis]|uniref:hypothetical protein n=1 Tax=Bacillus infantis TaxID=324767 RepID=UPI0013EC2555|nr:hypothetical protein [Bacillus infantis]
MGCLLFFYPPPQLIGKCFFPQAVTATVKLGKKAEIKNKKIVNKGGASCERN